MRDLRGLQIEYMAIKRFSRKHWLASPVTLGGNLPFCLVDGEHLIGRDDECDIIVRDVSVSRKHAIVMVSADRFNICDRNSTNGVYLDDERVESANFNRESKLLLGNVRLFVVPGENPEEVESWFEDSETYRQPHAPPIDIGKFADELTPTQLEILKLLLDGKSEIEISRACFRSQATIHNHVQAIYKRLDVHSLAELLRWVYGNTTRIVKRRSNSD